jgi:hypothetical protein
MFDLRISSEMTRAVGLAFAVLFVTVSLLGSVGSSWYLGRTLAPANDGPLAAFPSPAIYLAALAVVFEGLRFTLTLHAERIWERSRFQAFVLAAPLWLACTTYCVLVPLLTLAALPIFQSHGSASSSLAALSWGFVQLAAGLLPGLTWPTASPADRSPKAAAVSADNHPAPALAPTSCADDFLQVLARLTELPEGSSLSQRGRIEANREIVTSQAELANLVGRSPPTVRRWLQDLERNQRIVRSTVGKETRIRLQPHPAANGQHPPTNGNAHV